MVFSKHVYAKYVKIATVVREVETGRIPWSKGYEKIQRIVY